MKKRKTGVLLHVSSLPSNHGIGTFGRSAYEFVDFLVEAGQTYWQVLPLGPTSYGDSPYQSFSTFAGNPYFIDLDFLVVDGFLEEKDLEGINWGTEPMYVDYAHVYENRFDLLRKAYRNFTEKGNTEALSAFCEKEAKEEAKSALFLTIAELADDIELIELDRYKEIVENIVCLGLKARVEIIINKKGGKENGKSI